MKRVVIVLIAALAAGCLLQGCAKTVTTPDDAGTGHSPAQTAAAPDDAVYAYSLGVCIEAEQGAELSALHNEYMQGTGVKQIVCRTEFSAGMEREVIPEYIYTYDDFISLAAAPGEQKTFRDGYELQINVGGTDAASFPEYVPIYHDPVFGAVEALLMSRNYDAAVSEELYECPRITFVSTDPEGAETEYTVFRDGTAACGEKASSEKLTRDETAYFFAVYAAYERNSITERSYDVSDKELEGKAVLITTEDGERILKGDELKSFIKLVSDSDGGDYGFSCVCRVNCGAGEHGKELLGFSIGTLDEASGKLESRRDYYLMEDGHVVSGKLYGLIYASAYSYLYDCVYFDSYCVSNSAFDTEAVAALLIGD